MILTYHYPTEVDWNSDSQEPLNDLMFFVINRNWIILLHGLSIKYLDLLNDSPFTTTLMKHSPSKLKNLLKNSPQAYLGDYRS